LLAGCVSVPLSTMWKMRNFDFLSTSPSEFRFAVITDDTVKFNDVSISLSISYKTETPKESVEEKYFAVINPNAIIPELKAKVSANQSITQSYLKAEDAQRLKLVQNKINALRDQGIKVEGSLSINVNTGCFTQAIPASLIASIYARFDQQGYLPMQQNIDLLKIDEKVDQKLWQQCN